MLRREKQSLPLPTAETASPLWSHLSKELKKKIQIYFVIQSTFYTFKSWNNFKPLTHYQS